jgi:hypothetical protein
MVGRATKDLRSGWTLSSPAQGTNYCCRRGEKETRLEEYDGKDGIITPATTLN